MTRSTQEPLLRLPTAQQDFQVTPISRLWFQSFYALEGFALADLFLSV
jgi:hypothetical protein